jgi:RNA polymerase sigma factor (sigma-70 family)
MPPSLFDHLLRHVRSLAGPGETDAPSDAQLLEAFARQQDEAAFAALLERHGRMVLGVCARVLPDRHEAQDAFQSTFLVLARKASSIRKLGSVGSWLHGVAYRLAVQMKRAQTQRRRVEERASPVMSTDRLSAESEWRELRPLLDEEVLALPEKYRAPLVLCYLEEKSNEEAAAQLGWAVGTLKTRLARARDILQRRLTRRGVVLSAGLFAGPLQQAVEGAVPRELFQGTLAAAFRFAAGSPLTEASNSTARCAEELMTAMFKTQVKRIALLTLVLGTMLAGTGALIHHLASAEPRSPAAELGEEAAPGDTPPSAAGSGRLPPGALARIGEPGHAMGEQFLPDGKHVMVSVCVGFGYHELYDLASGRKVCKIDGGMHSIAFPPDGKEMFILGTMAGRDWNHAVEVRNAATGKRVRSIVVKALATEKPPPPAGPVSEKAAHIMDDWSFSPGCRILAYHNFDGIILTDLADGHELRRFGTVRDAKEFLRTKTREESVTHHLTCSPDGKLLASLRSDEDLCIWEVSSGKKRQELQLRGPCLGIRQLVFSPDGKKVALWTKEKGAQELFRCWDIATRKELLRQPVDGQIYELTFSPDGKRAALRTYKDFRQELRCWELATQRELLRQPVSGYHHLTFSPDSTQLATDNVVYDVAAGKKVLDVKPAVALLLFARPDSDVPVAIAANDWERATGKPFPELGWRPPDSKNDAALSRDGKTLALPCHRSIRLFRTADGKELGQIVQDDLRVHSVDFSPDGKRLACAGTRDLRKAPTPESHVVRVWDLAAGKPVLETRGKEKREAGTIWALFLPDAPGLLVGTQDGTKLLDPASGKPLQEFPWKCSKPRFSPDGRLLGIPAAGRIAILDWAAKKELHQLGSKEGARSSLSRKFAFSADSRHLATTVVDGRIQVFDLKTGASRVFLGPGFPINDILINRSMEGGVLGFCRAGKALMTYHEQIHCWELGTLKERFRLPAHQQPASWSVVSADGRVAVTGADSILIWDLAALEKGRPFPLAPFGKAADR